MWSTPLHKYLTANTLSYKVNNLVTETVIMSHATFEHMTCTDVILSDYISCLRSVHLFDSLDPQWEGKGLDMTFWGIAPIHVEPPTEAEQNEIQIHEKQHVALKFWSRRDKKTYKKQTTTTLNWLRTWKWEMKWLQEITV